MLSFRELGATLPIFNAYIQLSTLIHTHSLTQSVDYLGAIVARTAKEWLLLVERPPRAMRAAVDETTCEQVRVTHHIISSPPLLCLHLRSFSSSSSSSSSFSTSRSWVPPSAEASGIRCARAPPTCSALRVSFPFLSFSLISSGPLAAQNWLFHWWNNHPAAINLQHIRSTMHSNVLVTHNLL